MHSVDELFALAAGEQDTDVRWDAIRELHALGTREVFERAVSWSASVSVRERVAAAEILGQLSAFVPGAITALSSMTEDGEAAVVEAAVHGLANQQDASATETLARLVSHESPNVRWAVATALENLIGDERAERALLALMRDQDSSVRDHATFAIGSLSEQDSPRIRAALAERLADEDPSVSHEAALGLARRHDPRAILYIANAVERGDGEIAEAADEITAAEMLPELLKAAAANGSSAGVQILVERCRGRA